MGKLETLAMIKIGAPWWPCGEIWGPRPLILFKRFNTASLHFFKLNGPNILIEKFQMSCKLKKNTWGPHSPLFLLYFKDCVMITNVWFWYCLSSTQTHGDISGWGSCPGIWKVSFSLFFYSFSSLFFSFFYFFSFLFFIFLSLSWGPF